MKYFAMISTNDCYRVYFEVPDGMSNDAIEQYIFENFGGSDDEIIEFGPLLEEASPIIEVTP